MKVADKTRLSYPLVDDLYWLAPARDAGEFYSPSNFYFASSDGSQLVPAIKSKTRFISALTTEIASLAGLDCVPGLQKILDGLTASEVVPAPRYPQIGDVAVYGYVMYERHGGLWRTFRHGSYIPICVGAVLVDISCNSYDTPPSTLANANSDEIGVWRLQFTIENSTVERGQLVMFDITRATDLDGNPSCAIATNIRQA